MAANLQQANWPKSRIGISLWLILAALAGCHSASSQPSADRNEQDDTDRKLVDVSEKSSIPRDEEQSPSSPAPSDRSLESISDGSASGNGESQSPGEDASVHQSLDEMLALFPAKYPAGDWHPQGTFEECTFTSSDGVALHGWHWPAPQPRAVILHLHGNAGNVTHRAAMARNLVQRFNVSVMLFDYRGYGRSEGVATIDGLSIDARAARSELAKKADVDASEIVLMGESMGGGVAVDLASTDGARGLILQSTFSSLRDAAGAHYPKLLVKMLVKKRLESAATIANYHGPLLQMHGTADRVVPFSSGKRLFDAANEPKTFIRVPGGDHNDPPPAEFFVALDAFLDALPGRAN